jgi:protocatechuate 3,4-dioxygenase beta subunit
MPPIDLDRRHLLMGLAATVACTGSALTKDDDPAAADDTDDPVTADTSGVAWATGGTAAMASSYDVTFDETCAQVCDLTLGPCYADTRDRRDISEAVDGLGTRMAFRVVDTDCAPVAGAVVDVWHCSPSGLYSGEDAAQMCTAGDSAARAGHWFRGTQITDADGRVDFDTCLPGWYPGRAVHIHFQVRVGGDAYVTSQLGFPTALLADVYANHPAYRSRGQPDTSNQQDNILRDALATHLFAWRKADDGALVLSKTLVVRASLAQSAC